MKLNKIYWLAMLAGFVVGCGNRTPKDLSAMSVGELKSVASAGNAHAMVFLGLHLDAGSGVVKNISEAFQWYQRAAESGDSEGQYWVGYCYQFGRGVGKDYNQSYKWFYKAATNGYLEAQVALAQSYHKGLGVPTNNLESFRWYRRAADQGHMGAEYMVGLYFSRGIGTETNFEESFQWFKKSAEGGFVKAQAKMSDCFHQGLGVEHDTQKAFEWCLKAALQGDLMSQYHTSVYYGFSDNTTNQDEYMTKAYMWLSIVTHRDPGLGDVLQQFFRTNGVTFAPNQIKEAEVSAMEFLRQANDSQQLPVKPEY